MAHKPVTLEEIRASRPKIDRARIAATTEADIRRHQVEDGDDPNAPRSWPRCGGDGGAEGSIGPSPPDQQTLTKN